MGFFLLYLIVKIYFFDPKSKKGNILEGFFVEVEFNEKKKKKKKKIRLLASWQFLFSRVSFKRWTKRLRLLLNMPIMLVRSVLINHVRRRLRRGVFELVCFFFFFLLLLFLF